MNLYIRYGHNTHVSFVSIYLWQRSLRFSPANSLSSPSFIHPYIVCLSLGCSLDLIRINAFPTLHRGLPLGTGVCSFGFGSSWQEISMG